MEKIKKFIENFCSLEKINLNCIHKIGKKYFYFNNEILDLKNKINKEIFSAGLFLGEDRQEFKPSLALLEILSKHSAKKVFINREAEWLFTCGRDVFQKSIIKMNVDSGLVLVQNEQDENLGYGRIITGNKIFIKNILDKGNYLRMER